MTQSLDRLYELLPAVHRQQDEAQGGPLKALLQIISEQVNLVEDDISQLYENWFIETCEDWAVPYIADLIGYRTAREAGTPGDITTPQGQQRNKILIPRREVANTIRYRQRKGTLALLELLANDVADWPARSVEFYKLLGWTQHLNHRRPLQGRTVDLRNGDALDRLNSPFDELAHTIDVRRIQSAHGQGRYNLPNVGVFIFRLKAYSVTRTPAYCLEEVGPHCYTFSVLGNNTPLYTKPQLEGDPTSIADELNLPIPIRRRRFQKDHKVGNESYYTANPSYYGEGKSLQIWMGAPQGSPPGMQSISPDQVIVADLSDWQYRCPPEKKVVVDPVLGRMVFPVRQLPKSGVWVYYHYGFSADIGGGEYDRPLFQPTEYTPYRVGRQQDFATINLALAQWNSDREASPQDAKLRHAVIEIADSGVYTEPLVIHLNEQCSLQIRAANRTRPVIRLLDYQADSADSLQVYLQSGSQFTLDGLLIMGRGIQVQSAPTDLPMESAESGGIAPLPPDSLPVRVKIRHSTLVPGWGLHYDCEPRRPNEPSLELFNLQGNVEISHSIVGSIQVMQDEVRTDPLPIRISDSIIDATGPEQVAIDAPGYPVAHAQLTILRSTVVGQILTHAIVLAENSIFDGKMLVARRQLGCIRFCYVTPDSRTPRRYNCQPDLVEAALPPGSDSAATQRERDRVRPQFNSTRYSTPTYCQLAHTCAEEIQRGADDESEMGVFHDLYQPQRAANLRVRFDEYTPADMDAGIFYAT
jgi:hypothetical protein